MTTQQPTPLPARPLGRVNKKEDYIHPEDGWSSLRGAAEAYLRDPSNLRPQILQGFVNRLLEELGTPTRSLDPKILLNLIDPFGRLVIDIGDPAFALYPYAGKELKHFSVSFEPTPKSTSKAA